MRFVKDMAIPDTEREPDEAGPMQGPDKTGKRDEERLAYFVRMLGDDIWINRWKAAESLGRMGNSGAVEPLIDTLWDDDSRVRLKAAWALGRIGDGRALLPLKRLYRMEKEGVKEIITEAIEEINRQSRME
jgi:HEAT repeat protein